VSAPAERLDPWQWLGAPFIACVLATWLFTVPIRIAGLQLPEPIFALVPAFAWPMIRPSILAPFLLLALGLFMDLVWGGPLGLWPLALLMVYGLVLFARPIMTGQSWPMMWAWFAFCCFVAMAVGYAISILDSGMAPSLLATFWQLLPTCVLYPFAHRLIERFEDADVRFR
jgi:rod shape-determining protein MreD